MLNKEFYEECYCPNEKDATNPYNWKRKHYLLTFPKDIEPYYPSDGDLESVVSKLIPADKKLTNTAVGVYLRLTLIDYFQQHWTNIFKFGEEKETIEALNLLLQEGYLYSPDENTIKITKI